jgi:dihydroorotate dehydrogenase electron transfer subunit
MANDRTVKILSNNRLSADTNLLAIDIPPDEVEPFRFVMVQVTGGGGLILRRPLGIFSYEDSTFLLIKTVGAGTKAICNTKPGEELRMSGPFGSPECARLLTGYDKIGLVMGGIGAAGILQFAIRNPGKTNGLFFGSTTIWETAFYEMLKSIAGIKTLAFSTDDGTFAHHGLITDLLEKERGSEFCDAVLACGPLPMLKSVHDMSIRYGIPCFVSLEARMACGLGACRGCVVPVVADYNDGGEYRLVCEDGPLFDSQVIEWDRINE